MNVPFSRESACFLISVAILYSGLFIFFLMCSVNFSLRPKFLIFSLGDDTKRQQLHFSKSQISIFYLSAVPRQKFEASTSSNHM